MHILHVTQIDPFGIDQGLRDIEQVGNLFHEVLRGRFGCFCGFLAELVAKCSAVIVELQTPRRSKRTCWKFACWIFEAITGSGSGSPVSRNTLSKR